MPGRGASWAPSKFCRPAMSWALAGLSRAGSSPRPAIPFDSERTSVRIVPADRNSHEPLYSEKFGTYTYWNISRADHILFAAPVAASWSAWLRLRGRNSLLTMWLWRRGRDADVVS